MSGLEFYVELASNENFETAPVSAFPHAPLSWDFDRNIVEGLILEVPYLTGEPPGATASWFAVIVRKVSYLVQLRWLGDDESDPNKYFWRHIAVYEERLKNGLDTRVFPLGRAKAQNKRLEPPRTIRDSRLNWANFVDIELRGRHVLPEAFHEKVREDNKSCFEKGMRVEATAIDKMSAVERAVVEGDVGRRIMFRYLDNSGIPRFCWFNEFSEMFMPCGWARLHGRELISTREYSDESKMEKLLENPLDENASIFHFKPLLIPEPVARVLRNYRFGKGSKLEVIDPSEPQSIKVGTVSEVLKNQYLVIRIDGMYAADGSEHQVCLHASSPYLLPAGFAAENNLRAYFQPPRPDFSYEGTTLVPRRIFQKVIPQHHFKRNQFLEAVGALGTDRIYVARIVKVVGHLVLVHFEGFDSKEDQFFPISSSDLYPVGWCHLVGHRLRTPLSNLRSFGDDDDYGGDDGRMGKTRRRKEIVARSHC